MDGVAQKPAVGSFGERLRREREMRAITLEEMADATKIGTRALRALEEEKFNQLPGGIFNKGFVRSYARYLGIDEEQAVADYLAAIGESGGGGDLSVIAEQVEAQRERERFGTDSPFGGLLKAVLIVALLGGAGYGGFRYYQNYELEKAQAEELQRQQQRDAEVRVQQEAQAKLEAERQAQLVAQQQAQQQALVDPNTPAAIDGATQAIPTTPTQAVGSTTAPAAASQSKLQAQAPAKQAVPASAISVTVTATKKAWISVRADGQSIFQQTLDPSDPATSTKSFQAKERMMLIVGNAAGISVEYNGRSLGTLGAEGQRRTVTFTPAGFEKQ